MDIYFRKECGHQEDDSWSFPISYLFEKEAISLLNQHFPEVGEIIIIPKLGEFQVKQIVHNYALNKIEVIVVQTRAPEKP